MDNKEKKEITSRTTIKAIITGFASYGIITIFISFLIIAFTNRFLNLFTGKSAQGLYITIPLMASIILYFVIHAICRISTYDVFKKCKTNPDNYKVINQYLTIFFIMCIILSIFLFLTMLYNNLKYQSISIELYEAELKSGFPENMVDYFIHDRISTFESSRTNLITATVILVISIAISFLSLITYQKKMITKYNEF